MKSNNEDEDEDEERSVTSYRPDDNEAEDVVLMPTTDQDNSQGVDAGKAGCEDGAGKQDVRTSSRASQNVRKVLTKVIPKRWKAKSTKIVVT